MVFGYLLEPCIEIDLEIFLRLVFLKQKKSLNFQPNFYQRFHNNVKFSSKEKRLHHMVEQKT
jgi:hypothetical protein